MLIEFSLQIAYALQTYVRKLVQEAYTVVGWEVPQDSTEVNHMRKCVKHSFKVDID